MPRTPHEFHRWRSCRLSDVSKQVELTCLAAEWRWQSYRHGAASKPMYQCSAYVPMSDYIGRSLEKTWQNGCPGGNEKFWPALLGVSRVICPAPDKIGHFGDEDACLEQTEKEIKANRSWLVKWLLQQCACVCLASLIFPTAGFTNSKQGIQMHNKTMKQWWTNCYQKFKPKRWTIM